MWNFKAHPTDKLRLAVVADWQAQPELDAILQDDVHLLRTAGGLQSGIGFFCLIFLGVPCRLSPLLKYLQPA